MLSVSMQKNPNRATQYWVEVCSRDDRAHLFHPVSTKAERQKAMTPMSTYQSIHHGGRGLVDDIAVQAQPSFLELSLGGPAATSTLSRSARHALTPRGGFPQQLSARGDSSIRGFGSAALVSERRRVEQGGWLVQVPPQGDCFNRRPARAVPRPEDRPPAGL
eukprot:TRINITY_DN93834_c0_g1_i1.p1 TRINITY_DN93834_c0_g1~~TRINITY_DN93834_c0_g1_i1.p1  ORF type:complete len:162 (+),score=21.24 TRINITY_DN93834_c0_g1_i1:130-615(+)